VALSAALTGTTVSTPVIAWSKLAGMPRSPMPEWSSSTGTPGPAFGAATGLGPSQASAESASARLGGPDHAVAAVVSSRSPAVTPLLCGGNGGHLTADHAFPANPLPGSADLLPAQGSYGAGQLLIRHRRIIRGSSASEQCWPASSGTRSRPAPEALTSRSKALCRLDGLSHVCAGRRR
jgi:hypothetical protein